MRGTLADPIRPITSAAARERHGQAGREQCSPETGRPIDGRDLDHGHHPRVGESIEHGHREPSVGARRQGGARVGRGGNFDRELIAMRQKDERMRCPTIQDTCGRESLFHGCGGAGWSPVRRSRCRRRL